MDFATSVDCYLIARRDTETRVVTGTKVHDTFACRGIGLFINRAWNRELLANAGRQLCAILELGSINVDGGGLGTRWDIGTSGGGDAVLDVGTSDRVSVERLDVEDDGDNIEVEPKMGAQVRGLTTAV